MSFDEAVALATGPGQAFETVEAQVRGEQHLVFRNAPASLRALLDWSRLRGAAPFVVYEDERMTYGELCEAADAFAAALVERGVGKGDRVAIAMRNFPEWIVAFFGTAAAGAVVVPLNAWWTGEELAYALGHSGSKVVVADSERIERLAGVEGGVDPLVIAVRHTGALPEGLRVERWEETVVPGRPVPDISVEPDDMATILYTSGTTGRPKGAVSTHRAVVTALMAFGARGAVESARRRGRARAVAEGDEGTPLGVTDSTSILVVPLFHVTGLVPVMLGSFTMGNKLVMMHKWDAERALELIERERVTMFVGVPTMVHDLLESPSFATRDTSSLVNVAGGGAPAPPELVRRVESSFTRGRPQIGYGMTETNAYGPGNSGDDYLRKPASAGRVLPIMQMRVVDAEGKPAPTGEIGEIEFRGANLISGYFNDEGATAAAFHDGWLRTGDLGYIDDEGFVFVVDRAKDMVLRGGENIYCAEVEAALFEHPAVSEVAVFGVPHPRLGEEPVAAVVLRQGMHATETELQDFVRERLAAFKVPARVYFHEEVLPRNAAGKILKRELRDQVVP